MTDFPKNAWYVAATSNELATGSVISRTVCDVPLAIFRTLNGAVSILVDQCPHRLFPLSAGKVTEQGLQCGYHGLTFAPGGQCVDIPSQPEIPPTACVRSFPAREENGLVWIWPGDASAAAAAPLPSFSTGAGYLGGLDFSCLNPSETWGVAGPHRIHIDANFMLAVDNLLDLTHTAFVHATTFDNAGILDSERQTKAIGDNQVVDFFGFKNSMSAPLRTGYMLDPDVRVFDNYLETYWYSPSVMILVHGAVPEGLDRETEGAIVLNTNIITPETSTTCHYFWAQSVYRNRGNGKVRDLWDVMTKAAFAEDEVTLRLQQQNLERFKAKSVDDGVALVLKADKGIVLTRRAVTRQIREEASAKSD